MILATLLVVSVLLAALVLVVIAAALGELKRQHELTRAALSDLRVAVAGKRPLVMKPVIVTTCLAEDRRHRLHGANVAMGILATQVQLIDQLRHGDVDLQRCGQIIDSVVAPVIGNRAPDKAPPADDRLAEQLLRQSARYVLTELEAQP